MQNELIGTISWISLVFSVALVLLRAEKLPWMFSFFRNKLKDILDDPHIEDTHPLKKMAKRLNITAKANAIGIRFLTADKLTAIDKLQECYVFRFGQIKTLSRCLFFDSATNQYYLSAEFIYVNFSLFFLGILLASFVLAFGMQFHNNLAIYISGVSIIFIYPYFGCGCYNDFIHLNDIRKAIKNKPMHDKVNIRLYKAITN